jgi:hypothetical protein
MVRGSTPYIDDYTDQQLADYRTIVLIGYRYHDGNTAWDRLDRWVQAGGSLYVETGWQYVDPDWDAGEAPAALPITSLRWTAIDPGAAVEVAGRPAPDWGALSYQGAAWGASAAGATRPGAEPLVTAGGKVLVARWSRGSGRVVWSGMNLLAHATQSKSDAEDKFIVDQASWLLPVTGSAQASLQPQWVDGEQAVLDLNPASGPALVLFKESCFPGWSARLETPSGTRPVKIEDAEMDFMLVHLDQVPAGSRLVFTYGPTGLDATWWSASVLALLLLFVWVVAPQAVARLGGVARLPLGIVRRRWWEEEE